MQGLEYNVILRVLVPIFVMERGTKMCFLYRLCYQLGLGPALQALYYKEGLEGAFSNRDVGCGSFVVKKSLDRALCKLCGTK